MTGDTPNDATWQRTAEHAALFERLLQVALDDAPLEALLGRALDELMTVSWLKLLPKSGIFLKDPAEDALRLVAERQLGPQITQLCSRIEYGHCLCGRAAAEKAVQHASCIDHRHETRFDDMAPHGHYNVPILQAGDVLGVLVVYLADGHQKDAEEVAFLERFADLIALIITAKTREHELHAAQAEADALMTTVRRHMIFSQTDNAGNITDVNEAFCDTSGYSRDDLIGAPHRIVNSGLQDRGFWATVWNTLRAGEAWHGEIANRAKDGSIYWVDSILMPIMRADGTTDRYLSLRHDITERKQAEEALSRMGRVVEHASNEVYVFDARELRFLLVNRGARDNLGYSSDEMRALTPIDIKPEFDEPRFRAQIAPLLAGERDLLRFETLHERKDGSTYPVEVNLYYARSESPPIFLAFVQDITARRKEEAAIRKLALFDPLTGLANRAHLMRQLETVLQTEESVQVLYMDLNRFKQINDTMGHAAGDVVLQTVAERLVEVFGPHAIASRLGGDEFVVVLTNLPAEAVGVLTDQLLEALDRPIQIDDNRQEIGASVGTATYPGDGGTAEELLQAADIAMYQAKTRGLGQCAYAPSMKSNLRWRKEVSERLVRALRDDKLSLVYQPFVELGTGALCGAETLLRWTDEELGPIAPPDIISIAEEYRLMPRLGRWITDNACLQISRWAEQGFTLPGRIAINASARQVEDGSIVEDIEAACEGLGISPASVEVEITESNMMADPDAAAAVLDRLRRTGVHIAIDDFGTGYSSLARLKQFEIDKLKIDLSFIRDIPADHASLQIVTATIAMAQGMGFKVLAEGVETAQQAALLEKLGCDYAQGYHFDRPLPADRFAARWLAPLNTGQKQGAGMG